MYGPPNQFFISTEVLGVSGFLEYFPEFCHEKGVRRHRFFSPR